MITMKALIAPGVIEGVLVQGGEIELPCKYFVYRPKEFKAQVKSKLGKRQ